MICHIYKTSNYVARRNSIENIFSNASLGNSRATFYSGLTNYLGEYKLIRRDVDARISAASTIIPNDKHGNNATLQISNNDIVEFDYFVPKWDSPYYGNSERYTTLSTNRVPGSSPTGRYGMSPALALTNLQLGQDWTDKDIFYRVEFTNGNISKITEHTTLLEAEANWPQVTSDMGVEIFEYHCHATWPLNYPTKAFPTADLSNINFGGAGGYNTNFVWNVADDLKLKIVFSLINITNSATIWAIGEFFTESYDTDNVNNKDYFTVDKLYADDFVSSLRLIASSFWAKYDATVYSRI